MIKLFKKTEKAPENLKDALIRLKKLEGSNKEIARELADFKNESRKDLQKVGIVRFNPFNEIGGNQSFSLAILDKNNDGFVITSHYGREANRVYAKPIKKGESEYSLSKEENEAISHAISQ